MIHARIEDRANHADYQLAVARARAARRTPPSRYRVRWRDEAGVLRSVSLPSWPLARAAQANIVHERPPLTLDRLVDQWAATPLDRGRPGQPQLPSRRTLDLHVLPSLGARRAAKITRADIEQLRYRLYAEGRLGVSTINRVLATLKRVFEFGVHEGLLPYHPALGIRPIPGQASRPSQSL